MQTAIVVLIVLAALAFVGGRVWRTLRPASKAGCGAGCGCGEAGAQGGDWTKT